MTLPATGTGADTITNHYEPSSGRLWKVVREIHGPNGVVRQEESESTYDSWGRVVETVGAPSGERLVTTVEYDPLGRAKATARRWVDEGPYDDVNYHDLDRVERREYDKAGRLKWTERRESPGTWSKTEYEYDRDGLQIAMIDANLQRTDWGYEDEALGLGPTTFVAHFHKKGLNSGGWSDDDLDGIGHASSAAWYLFSESPYVVRTIRGLITDCLISP